jgi:hypothetical protein
MLTSRRLDAGQVLRTARQLASRMSDWWVEVAMRPERSASGRGFKSGRTQLRSRRTDRGLEVAMQTKSRHLRRVLALASPGFLWSVAIVLAVGCSGASSRNAGGSESSGSSQEQDYRLAECEQYADKVAACFQRDELRSQVRIVAHNEAERDRMRDSCVQGLQRLSAACR